MRVAGMRWHTPYLALQFLTFSLLLSGCTGIAQPTVINQATYVLESQRKVMQSSLKRNLVLAVSEPQARPGFDTAKIVYVQKPHELNYFVTSYWADTPARMLEPLLIQAMEQTGSFRAIVQSADAVSADVRLDTELVRLQHDFTAQPSQILISLRAQLIDVHNNRVLAATRIEETENASSENAYGGVIAANRALQRVLDQLAYFCVNESVIK